MHIERNGLDTARNSLFRARDPTNQRAQPVVVMGSFSHGTDTSAGPDRTLITTAGGFGSTCTLCASPTTNPLGGVKRVSEPQRGVHVDRTLTLGAETVKALCSAS